MENKSILDQIITNQKAEEVANLDVVEIISNLFAELNEREKDVLVRRFGLHGKDKETLENIGSIHNLTRERIRQIETSAIKRLKQLEKLDSYLKNLKHVIDQLIEEHGGLIERDYLLNNLVGFSVSNLKHETDRLLHKNHLEFLLTKLLQEELEEVSKSKNFKNFFKFKHQDFEHLEELAAELVDKIKEAKKVMATADLMDLIKELEAFKKHEDKIKTPNNLDLSNVLQNDHFKEDFETVNNNKALYSVLQASKSIEQNKFGYWGIGQWREINPKTINDKIYLVLKNHGQPMHFVEIAEKINQIRFDKNKANPATVHNELILDNKYVLVGRGLYSLNEWGYKKGTVSDVIVDILNEAGKELSKDEILEKVLEQRMVKKATVILALMDKNKFYRVDNGKYYLKLDENAN